MHDTTSILSHLDTSPPPPSPVSHSLRTDPHIFTPALLAFIGAYYLISPFYPTHKQKAWILTGLSSFIMTALSIPFVVEYIRGGRSVASVGTSSALSLLGNRIFQAYLIADLLMGGLHYRKQVNLISGWIHHTLYVFIIDYAVRNSLTSIFSFCAAMELPTLILGLGTLHPRLRSDVLFALSFFLTRILFNIVVICAYARSENRIALLGGARAPAVMMTLALGMHAVWFKGCVMGFVKRARKARDVREAAAEVVGVVGLSKVEVRMESAAATLTVGGTRLVKQKVRPKIRATNGDSGSAAPKPASRFVTLPMPRRSADVRKPIPIPFAHGPPVSTHVTIQHPPATPDLMTFPASADSSPPRVRYRDAHFGMGARRTSASWHGGLTTPPADSDGCGSASSDEEEDAVPTPRDGYSAATTSAAVVVVVVPPNPSTDSDIVDDAELALAPVAKPWRPPFAAPTGVRRDSFERARAEVQRALAVLDAAGGLGRRFGGSMNVGLPVVGGMDRLRALRERVVGARRGRGDVVVY